MKETSRCTHNLINSFYLNLCIILIIIEIQNMLYLNKTRYISKVNANNKNDPMTLRISKKVWSHNLVSSCDD